MADLEISVHAGNVASVTLDKGYLQYAPAACTSLKEAVKGNSGLANIGLPTTVDLKKQSTYKHKHIDSFFRWYEDVMLKQWIVKWLPSRMSPYLLSVPGFILHVVAVVLLRQRWCTSGENSTVEDVLRSSEGPRCEAPRAFYAFWLFTLWITYSLDQLDGEHARRTRTQVPLRHFWDHIFDAIVLVFIGIESLLLSPSIHVPPAFSIVVALTVDFQVTFVRYFVTGTMLVPYTAYLALYMNTFVAVTSMIFSPDVWHRYEPLQYSVSAALACLFIVVLLYVGNNLRVIWRDAPHSSNKSFCSSPALRLLSMPVVIIIASAVGHLLLDPYPLAYALAIGAVQVASICDLHARQLLCQPFSFSKNCRELELFVSAIAIACIFDLKLGPKYWVVIAMLLWVSTLHTLATLIQEVYEVIPNPPRVPWLLISEKHQTISPLSSVQAMEARLGKSVAEGLARLLAYQKMAEGESEVQDSDTKTVSTIMDSNECRSSCPTDTDGEGDDRNSTDTDGNDIQNSNLESCSVYAV